MRRESTSHLRIMTLEALISCLGCTSSGSDNGGWGPRVVKAECKEERMVCKCRNKEAEQSPLIKILDQKSSQVIQFLMKRAYLQATTVLL